MIDPAPGWQIRCPKRGRTKPYGRVGARLGAASAGKRVLALCSQCRWPRLAVVERTPAAQGAAGR